jgi:hypothetical protein
MEIGQLKNSLIRDGASAGEPANWVTFRDAKKQIRRLIRDANLQPVGFFRGRSENRGEMMIKVEGGSVTARRKPGALVLFTKVTETPGTEIDTDKLADIMAQG